MAGSGDSRASRADETVDAPRSTTLEAGGYAMPSPQQSTMPPAAPTAAASAAAARSPWALGDYHRFALETVWQLGPLLVAACGVRAGQRVLDVAAGTGNVAIRAAEAGASVVACDITPEHFDAGRREAAHRGVELEWREGDAQRLPFEDAGFDVVTSCFGAIFAPDHRAVAEEMLRVCRPGGTIGMLNFRAAGTSAAFFELFARWAPPPPPDAQPPLLWGDEAHVRALFGERVASLDMRRGEYVERASGGADAYHSLFATSFGPAVAIRAALAGEPDRLAAFDAEFLDFARRESRGAPGGAAAYTYPYLLVVARKHEA
jgi:SAM-dependent methyltransferase